MYYLHTYFINKKGSVYKVSIQPFIYLSIYLSAKVLSYPLNSFNLHLKICQFSH